MAALILTTWSAILLALPFLGPTGRQVVLVGSQAQTTRAVLAAGGTILDYRSGILIARSSGPHFVAALYRHGVPLVLEARVAGGCIGMRNS